MNGPGLFRRRFLNGADWCVAALSEGTLATTGRRSSFQVAVFLEGAPDAEALLARFAAFCLRFPLLWGRPSRAWNLAPYWKYSVKADSGPPPHRERHDLPADATREEILHQVAAAGNAYASRSGCAVALDVVQAGMHTCVLAFAFDHRLFDAVGAESFIDLFFRWAEGQAREEEFPDTVQTEPSHLDQWAVKFRNGRIVNRMMRALAENPVSGLDLPADAWIRPFRFRETAFTAEESRLIQERAFAVAGYMMFTPYALAASAAAFAPAFREQALPGAHFVVSVSTDKPRGAVMRAHLFFNDLSFLYFRIPVLQADDRNGMALSVRDQLLQQVRDETPAAIEDANLLMRILPARLFWRFMMKLYKDRLASFGFTCLGESALKAAALMGCPVREQIHFPLMPAPPGVGIVMSRSGGVYHAVLSYLEGILSEAQADRVMADFRRQLLEEHPVR